MGVKSLKRIGFKVSAFLLIGMSHKEICDLLPGSYLAPKMELEPVCGKLEDAWVQLHGGYKSLKLQLVIAPMTREQTSQQFMATPNLEQFLEPKYLDTGVKDFRDRLASDCFFLDVDVFRTDVPTNELLFFLKEALEGVEKVAENAVQRLKSMRPKRGT